MSESTSVSSSSNPELSASEPLYQVKLLSALRSGDPALIHPFLAEIGKDRRKSERSDLDTGAAALHLAIRCGSLETVALLLSQRVISPNGVHPPGSGTTALHLAASLGRVDVVNLLLDQENIDDTRRDAQSRNCKDVARTKEVARAIEDSRSFLNAQYQSLLRTYIHSPSKDPPDTLISLLESPRVRFLNLSYLDDDSGLALLHEAARRKDLRLIELAVRAGADIFVRNRRGKMAYEGTGKDDHVRVFLRQFANHDTTLIDAPAAEPVSLKGYLNKYTNVAKGYNTRWFVLKDGIFSYYRHQEDETVASRGSISMKNARLKMSTTDRLRFEVHSTPSRGHNSGIQKWYMKANHPVEAARWATAISKSIEWYKRDDKNNNNNAHSGLGSEQSRGRKSTESESASGLGMKGVSVGGGVGVSPMTHSSKTSLSLSGTLMKKARQVGGHLHHYSGTSSHVEIGSPDSGGDMDATPDLLQTGVGGGGGVEGEREHSEEEDVDGRDVSSASSSTRRAPPHDQSFELHGNSTAAQVELTSQLLSNLVLPPDAPKKVVEVKKALHDSFGLVQGMINEYVQMVHDREEWWSKQLEKEKERQSVWEESLATVVREGENLEKELRMRSRKRGSRFFDSANVGYGGSDGMGTIKQRSSLAVPRAAPVLEETSSLESSTSPPRPLSPPSMAEEASHSRPQNQPIQHATGSSSASADSRGGTVRRFPSRAQIQENFHPRTPSRSHTQDTVGPFSAVPPGSAVSGANTPLRRDFGGGGGGGGLDDDDDDHDTDEEDEFFDAIEAGTLPNLVVNEALTSPVHSEMSLPLTFNVEPYQGYRKLRTSLNLSEERPSTSLWSVLKHSIGKDLTRISFPVFFNEPTSMLQRMAEDMEFSECLDAAAKEKDPLRRIAFVAGFAMSNYSSTIGRIAKPFNPMLSETFEYVRFDREYRYLSEQVSHHPPISACWAESPAWHYFGEVDAQNKFMGKSFEIRPTGVAHAELVLPAERGPNYPKAKGPLGEGKVIEHYSWKKVTTNVSGFILGSPTIDHYGDMIITNHRTRDQCILTFKPRGWRGKDAYEISGQVIDSKGRVAYEIAGRWNSQLVAQRVGAPGALHPDLDLDIDVSSSEYDSPKSNPPEYILLWRNSEKPSGSRFNLTPFAITLNDCPKETLKPFLCPTDCRLRPDQRAFELGKYELANQLKNEQEERQRATRKARDEGRVGPHKPRWFTAETDGDTGERVWTPSRVGETLEYWVEREKVWKEGKGNPQKRWKDVDPIFIEEPDYIAQAS